MAEGQKPVENTEPQATKPATDVREPVREQTVTQLGTRNEQMKADKVANEDPKRKPSEYSGKVYPSSKDLLAQLSEANKGVTDKFKTPSIDTVSSGATAVAEGVADITQRSEKPSETSATPDIALPMDRNKGFGENRGIIQVKDIGTADVKSGFDSLLNRMSVPGEAKTSLSKEDLVKALENGDIKGKEAVLCDGLLREFDTMKTQFGDGKNITSEGIQAFHQRQAQMKEPGAEKTAGGAKDEAIMQLDGRLKNRAEWLSGTNLDCFPQGIASIRAEKIGQGQAEDCYLMSAMKAVAAADPESIAKMIKYDPSSGNYSVKFPGADKPVTVSPPTEGELSHYAPGHVTGTWPAVLEKAYGKYCHENYLTSALKNSDRAAADGDSFSSDGLRILTGADHTRRYNWFNSADSIDKNLTEAFADKRAVTAWDKHFKMSTHEPVTGHEVAVTAYNPKTRVIDLQDPNFPDQVKQISVEQFKKEYMGLVYSDKKEE